MNAHTVITAAEAGLTPLEWRAVAIGMQDADHGIAPAPRRGRLGKLLAFLGAARTGLPLADSRLEALRRFAYAARRTGGRVADAVVQPLLDLGFATPQLATVALRARR